MNPGKAIGRVQDVGPQRGYIFEPRVAKLPWGNAIPMYHSTLKGLPQTVRLGNEDRAEEKAAPSRASNQFMSDDPLPDT
jgi:hypothetical protein